jgi:hypothetical protein
MLDHILGELRITDDARAALGQVRAKLAELDPPSIVASEPGGESSDLDATPSPAAAPLVLAHDTLATAGEPTGHVGRSGASPTARQRRRRRRDEAPAAVPASDSADGPRPDAGLAPAPAAHVASDELGAAPPTATMNGPPQSFADVWRDLQSLGARSPGLHALAGQVSSEIREVSDDGIWLYSHGIGREYRVTRDLLETAWATLVSTGRLVPRELRMSYGAVTLLAHLPYVDYSADPVALHYPAVGPHPLGTVQRRDEA